MPKWEGRNSVGKVATIVVLAITVLNFSRTECRLADRARVVDSRVARGRYSSRRDNGRPIEGQNYRTYWRGDAEASVAMRKIVESNTDANKKKRARSLGSPTTTEFKSNVGHDSPKLRGSEAEGDPKNEDTDETNRRRLGSQLTGCCSNYQSYSAVNLCAMYGEDCESGEMESHDSGDDDCSQEGLSFIGVSFSVNTASGNPFSYQLCDQFPMENIIDRDYNYVMSMDEDGWLIGGGYKTFDYSGKMPYIDSSHTELLRIGSMDPDKGGTSIEQVYSAMEGVTLPPLSIFPEYLKGGGGHHSGDEDGDGDDEGSVPSGDVTLIVSVVESYYDDDNYSCYEKFLDDLFSAMYNVGGGPCMDDHDTDPHVSMSRGVKFKSSYHLQQYMYEANLEVAVWQAMYPNGVAIGSDGWASFPPGRGGRKTYVGYGNLYFFFDRANITKAFPASRDLTDDESYYSTYYMTNDVSSFYSSTTEINFDYSGSGDDGSEWEHNPYAWKATMAKHDMTDGWDLPPNCNQEGESFFGIPLSRKSYSKLQSTGTFQEQFDFEYIVDRNYTYIQSFGTNHGWLVGEEIGNGAGSIVDRDTAHIPIFYTGTTNVDMGGMSLASMIKIAKHIEFGTLYIKPAFVFVDDDGHVKLQFEADPYSALAYLYDSLCKEIGIAWNNDAPENDLGLYTNCAMHGAGDRAQYGCGPDGSGYGGFCPQMYLGYSVRFQSEDHAAAYLEASNNYVDYWRSLYPSGVAVGTSNFCSNGGCLGLFLNRYDLYTVFKPDLGGSWVEYHGASMAPTYSPAPTWPGGCNEPHNMHLDACFRKNHRPRRSIAAWDSLGPVGQFSVFLILFMGVTLSISIFLARARKRKRKNESYLAFFFNDLMRKKKKKKGKKRKKKLGGKMTELEESMLADDRVSRRSRSKSAHRSRSRSKSVRSRTSGRSKSSRSKAVRATSVQPDGEEAVSERRRSTSRSGRSRTSSRSRKSKSEAGGVMDVAVSQPQSGEEADGRY